MAFSTKDGALVQQHSRMEVISLPHPEVPGRNADGPRRTQCRSFRTPIPALLFEPAVLEVAHVFEDGLVLPDKHRLDESCNDEGRD